MAAKMVSLGTLVSGVAHEINNPVTSALLNTQTLRKVWESILPILDKHSTGGVGDKVSFLVAPIAAACGLYVPMISGRGLGHTGGTTDKIESIPGYDATPGFDHFRRVVRETGCAIIGQTADLAPRTGGCMPFAT